MKERTYRCWKKQQYLIRWKGYLLAHNSWVNQEDMHADDLLHNFADRTLNLQSAIRAGNFALKHQPFPLPSFHQPMSQHDTPINISTPSPTSTLVYLEPLTGMPLMEPHCQNPLSACLSTLHPASTTSFNTTSTSGPLI